MNKASVISLVAIGMFCVSPAAARDAAFVQPGATHAMELLQSPPADGSDRQKAELEELHRLQKQRSESDTQRAMADDKNETIFIYASVFGDAFKAENLPLTAALSARVKNDEGIHASAAKEGFHRVRPYNSDKTLEPVCKTKIKDDAYPSGHATTGYLEALVLIEMVPEKRDEILARAEDYAHNRLVCGVHYRSDIEASKLMAYTIHALMSVDPQFRTELAAAKAELRQNLNIRGTN